ncbi:hypothetical protein NDU88_005860 [Pleurodeles waltl]|uniref:Uncharacterized protein n=1 Tax=Pleurodeles waltl TaxID=8319 RepID=A0AAV7QKA3_PLEWA|nr:hypothetical protein NDU88_005860 [Pleurodeles waltl]
MRALTCLRHRVHSRRDSNQHCVTALPHDRATQPTVKQKALSSVTSFVITIVKKTTSRLISNQRDELEVDTDFCLKEIHHCTEHQR